MNCNIALSEDGSHTIYSKEFKEHYHSIHGAITESLHIFIENGLHTIKTNPVNILEIGFGTGLNAFLTLIGSVNNKRLVYYETLELYPLEKEITDTINYADFFKNEFKNYYHQIHECKWNEKASITKEFEFKKIKGDATKYEFSTLFDLIYFDAFSPENQPEMWTKQFFEKLYLSMKQGGILTTYCAKGIVKRTLKEIGFSVELLPGPPGKRHIIRAVK
jgi:tRNA U34 5-methylaminomethyl-2-thiouridine-forming methyltransferase MnmC